MNYKGRKDMAPHSTIDPDIMSAELILLKAKEEELVFELEQTRASIHIYENKIYINEDMYNDSDCE